MYIIGIYLNFRDYREKNVLFQTPFYKISNKYHVLYYLKTITEKINTIEQNENDKAIITGIIQMHMVECPNENCILKNNCKLYLPISQEWSFRDKPFIYDKVFLINFVIAIMNFYISQNFFCADMLINISFYYLTIIGNYCLSMYYYKKVKEMKLTLQEQFSLIRLELAISKALVEKMKPPNEPCFSLEDLNVTMYYKYEDLSQNFFDEMNKKAKSYTTWKAYIDKTFDVCKKKKSMLLLSSTTCSPLLILCALTMMSLVLACRKIFVSFTV